MRASMVMAISVLVLLAACRSDEGKTATRGTARALPSFAEHAVPAEEIFRGTPEPPDAGTSPMARRYRGQIAAGMKKGVNFAGHYLFISWDCGAACQQSAVVDARTGRVFPGPEGIHGYKYTVESLLLIVNPPDASQSAESAGAGRPEYWLWQSDGFHRIDL